MRCALVGDGRVVRPEHHGNQGFRVGDLQLLRFCKSDVGVFVRLDFATFKTDAVHEFAHGFHYAKPAFGVKALAGSRTEPPA